MLRLKVKNEGVEDWRGCYVSLECDDYSDAETAKPHYSAKDLTLQGGAVPAAESQPPEVRAVGTVAAGVGAISPGLPAGTEAGDLLLMVAESGGATTGAEANTALTAAGWGLVTSQKKGNTRLTVLSKIAVGGDATLTNDTGDHQMARIIGIKAGTFDPAAPINVTETGTQAATKAVSIPGAPTSLDNCLIVACASGNLPDATGATEFSGATNASLTGLTERIDNTTAEGDGGAIWAVTGAMAKEGSFAATTGTAVTEAERAVISVAVSPRRNAVKCPPLTAGWVTVLSSEIDGVGHMTHIGGRRMLFRVNDPSEKLDSDVLAEWVAGGEEGTKPVSQQVNWKLEWRALGAAAWMQTQEGSTPIVKVSPVVGDYQLLDMGGFSIPAAIRGDQRWECRLQACVPSGSGVQPLIRDVYPTSTEQWMRVADTRPDPIDGAPIKAPGTVEDATGAGTAAWSNPSNVKAEDGSCATAEGSEKAAKESHYLKATNFGFAIPSSASIKGISVEVRRRRKALSAASVEDKRVRIIKGGTVKEAQDKAVSKGWGWSLAGQSYGGPEDLWGQTWTPSDINASTFGLALSVWLQAYENPLGGTFEYGKAEVDAIKITVYFSEGANTETHICFAGRSVEFTDNGVRRQHVTDEVWGDLVPDGFTFYSPPQGQEGKATRALIIPTVGDFEARADSASVSPSLKVYQRAAYLFAREAAE